jgi:phosphate transport system protein
VKQVAEKESKSPVGKPARKRYREQLDEVRAKLLKMGEISLETVQDARQLLLTRSTELMDAIGEKSETIDRMEFELEKRIVDIMALQQPMAGDLRALTASLRIINDIDRVSDLAHNIVKIVRDVGDKPWYKPLIDLPRMAETSEEMLKICLEAYRTGVVEPLEKLGDMDNVVDELDHQIRRESVTYMISDPSVIKQASQIAFIARYLERIADHITSIGARIIYIYTGERRKLN